MSEQKRFYGDDAVREAAKYYGHSGIIDPTAYHLIREEGFVPTIYEDDKGIPTEGVGLTGEFIGKNFFSEVMPEFENRARRRVEGYDMLPDEVRSAVLSGVYRGDLGPKTAELMSEGKWEAAAKEYLNHKGYKDRKSKDKDDGVVQRMDRNAAVFREFAKEAA